MVRALKCTVAQVVPACKLIMMMVMVVMKKKKVMMMVARMTMMNQIKKMTIAAVPMAMARIT